MNTQPSAEQKAPANPPIEVFLSYAPEDEELQKHLEKHLSLLKRQGMISTWQNRQIVAGADRAQAIDSQLERAQVILLLVSADFLASDYCYGREMQRALQRHRTGQARVIPILLRPVDWYEAPFAHLQALPTNGQAITSWKKRDEAFADVASGLRQAIAEISSNEASEADRGPAASVDRIDSATPPGPVREVTKQQPTAAKSSAMDVCVVCALAEEAQAFLRVVEQQCRVAWISAVNVRYGYDYRHTTIRNVQGEPLQVYVSWLPRYGPQNMILHLTHVLEEYQPRLAVMTGICAGDRRHVLLGDLVVAERTFTYDMGKIDKDEEGRSVHLKDTLTYQANENLLRFIGVFEDWKARVAGLPRPASKRQQRDWLLERLFSEPSGSIKVIPRAELEQYAPAWRHLLKELQQGAEPFLLPSLTLRDREQVEQLSYGHDPFPYHDPAQVQCHIRPLASGSAVRSDDPFQEIQIPVRGAIAIDMEGAAFGRVLEGVPAIQWLIVKGVSDYADQDKDDTYHSFAAEVSATYALSFLQHYVTQQRFPVYRQDQHAEPPSERPAIYNSGKNIISGSIFGGTIQFNQGESIVIHHTPTRDTDD